MSTAGELLHDLESRGHHVRVNRGRLLVTDGEDLTDDDRQAITATKAELLEALDTPLERTGRSKGRAWRATLTPVGRALLRAMTHEGSCARCARGAMRGCDIGRRLWKKMETLR